MTTRSSCSVATRVPMSLQLKMQRMRRLRLFPGPEHVHESVLKDPSTKAFEVQLPPGDGQPKVVPLDKLPSGPD